MVSGLPSSGVCFDHRRGEPYLRFQSNDEEFCLTPVRNVDVEAIVPILNDPAVYTHLLTPYPYTKEHAEVLVNDQVQKYELDRQFFTGDERQPISTGKIFDYNPMLAIRQQCSDGSQQFLGILGMWRSMFLYEAVEHRKLELKTQNEAKAAGDPSIIYSVAYYLDPAVHGKGIMTAALHKMIHSWAIPHIDVHEITVGIIEDNWASRKVLDKLGFKLVEKVDGVTPTQGRREVVLGQWLMRYTVE
ncbi:hypothetical protein DACRYDRAFT_21644 [Dacryopinax primogenitus]|uniref:N-acetyltransferase domain-containing protein n=1 Tax=Dacryopinax primogenitus (strain DJM 731) TaxID=1858805 RepID=M5GDP0_DACPD|nr:uncharacterized protein DACRYDRAFT_21644 [Dacryopinax primogenitus]EJU02583.1 hypothetical protein DACRYDRAFT_21644 [Dacryopinax primogenitus]